MSEFGLKSADPTPAKPEVTTSLLAGIRPRTTPRAALNIEESDRVAATAGFTSREPSPATILDSADYATPLRRKRKPEPLTSLSMRLPRSIHERFRDFADGLNIPYPEALEKLLNDSEVLSRLQRQ